MRSIKFLALSALVAGICSVAAADLQNVEVGGQIRIRANWYDYDHSGGETAFVEQRTRLNVKADFTDDVSAFIEFDDYGVWGTAFRSNWLTGVDGTGAGDVSLYQSYIEANNMWGSGLRMRIGRQELSFGSQWLIGVNDASSLFRGLSFDGLRLTYATDQFSVDVFGTKLAETFGKFSQGDTDFYGVYASYLGIEDITIDAYYLFLRDDGNLVPDSAKLHTFGLRGAGKIGTFDFDAEAAYQTGKIKLPGDDLKYKSNWGANLEVGYTFDMSLQPRLYVGGAYLQGGDNGDNRLFHHKEPTLGFNRLFSNWEYSEFLANTDESNLLLYRAGVSVMPTEKIKVSLAGTYFTVDQPNETHFLWWTHKADDTLGWELGLYGDYHYSEDLVFRGGYVHFFGDKGLQGGNRVIGNGLLPYLGDKKDDYDYLFFETEVSF